MIITLLSIIVAGCVPSKPAYEEQILPADRLIKQLEKVGSDVTKAAIKNVKADKRKRLTAEDIISATR